MAYIDPKTRKLIYSEITYPSVVQANYLASRQDEHYVDDVINLYTGLMPWNYGTPPCSHTEICFWIDGELWSFSSTSRSELGVAGKNGTRWKKGSELFKHPDRWLLQETLQEEKYSIRTRVLMANYLIGLSYDFYGVGADFINPFRVCFKAYLTCPEIKKLKKIYCSKAVHAVDTGMLEVMSPKRRYKVAKKSGYIDIPDTESYLLRRNVIS